MIGIFGGRFTPLHNGHVGAILRASEQVDRLYVVLSYADNDPIHVDSRYKWMKGVFHPYDNIFIVKVERKKILSTKEEWLEDSNNIRNRISSMNDQDILINKVFVGSDDHKDMFQYCYPEAEYIILDALRSDIHISGTEIRSNVFKYWEYLPKLVRKDYSKGIHVSDKKLLNQLTDRFNTVKAKNPWDDLYHIYGSAMIRDIYIQSIITAQHLINVDNAKYDANKIYFTDRVLSPSNEGKELYDLKSKNLDDAIEEVKNIIENINKEEI